MVQTGGWAWKILVPAGRAPRGSGGTLGSGHGQVGAWARCFWGVPWSPAACPVDGAGRSGGKPSPSRCPRGGGQPGWAPRGPLVTASDRWHDGLHRGGERYHPSPAEEVTEVARPAERMRPRGLRRVLDQAPNQAPGRREWPLCPAILPVLARSAQGRSPVGGGTAILRTCGTS